MSESVASGDEYAEWAAQRKRENLCICPTCFAAHVREESEGPGEKTGTEARLVGVHQSHPAQKAEVGAGPPLSATAAAFPLVAALYVETGGAYFGLDGVDPWDEARDARLYAGPYPVVAHPPCARWSIMGNCRGYRDGEDGGCFEAALRAVREFGGVLEHPAHTLAWERFELPDPGLSSGYGWVQSFDYAGWTCEVDQRLYGHEARKPTWLYYCGDDPPPMRWGRGTRGERTVGRGWGGGREHLRARTPIEFRDVLLTMARSVRQEVAA